MPTVCASRVWVPASDSLLPEKRTSRRTHGFTRIADRNRQYTPVPLLLSDEDEGVYDAEDGPEYTHTQFVTDREDPPNENKTSQKSEEKKSDAPEKVNAKIGTVENGKAQTELVSASTAGDNNEKKPDQLTDATKRKAGPPFSLLRWMCLILSVLLCVTYVILLLWAVPCELAPCNSAAKPQERCGLAGEWDTSIRGASEGQPTIINCMQLDSKIIIPLSYSEHSSQGFIEAINLADGKEVWQKVSYTNVLGVQCNIGDINQDGKKDCVMVGRGGIADAFSPDTGNTFWFLHNHSELDPPENLSLPISLPDINHDGVDELAFTCLLSPHVHHVMPPAASNKQAHLLIVSGLTGQILSHPIPVLPTANPTIGTTACQSASKPAFFHFQNGTAMILLACSDGLVLSTAFAQLSSACQAGKLHSCDAEVSPLPVGGSVPATPHMAINYTTIFTAIPGMVDLVVEDVDQDGTEDVLVVSSSGQIALLNGSLNLAVVWMKRFPGSEIIRPVVLGRYTADYILDVAVVLGADACFAPPCLNKAVIIDGKDGRELNDLVVEHKISTIVKISEITPLKQDMFVIKVIQPPHGTQLQTNETRTENVLMEGVTYHPKRSGHREGEPVVLVDQSSIVDDFSNDLTLVVLGQTLPDHRLTVPIGNVPECAAGGGCDWNLSSCGQTVVAIGTTNNKSQNSSVSIWVTNLAKRLRSHPYFKDGPILPPCPVW